MLGAGGAFLLENRRTELEEGGRQTVSNESDGRHELDRESQSTPLVGERPDGQEERE